MAILLFILLLMFGGVARAQQNGPTHFSENFNALMTNVPSAGQVPVATGRSTAHWASGGGGGGSPGGTNGQIQYNASGSFGGFTMSGDCTINTSTGVIACPGSASNGQLLYDKTGTIGGLTMMGDCSINTSTGAINCSKINGVTPGGSCSGSTPFVASLSSQAVPTCMTATTSPFFTAATLGANSGTGGSITLNGSTSGSAVLSVAAAAGTTTFQLPVGNGTNGQFIETDGSGHLSYASPSSGGTVNAGTAGQMAYYATTAAAVSGNPNATISSGALTLGVAGSVQGSAILAGATSGALTLAAPAAVSSYSVTFPGAAPTQGAFLYASNGSGTLASLTAGSSGQLLVGQTTSTVPSWVTLSGDCTISNVGAITCTTTNGVAFAASATTNALVASNISSGTLACGRLPALTGDTTTSAGSCATTTGAVDGVAYPASPTTHQVPVVTASNTVTYKTLPNCPTAGGTQTLNYTQSTDSFSCGTVSGGGGGGGPIISPQTINGSSVGGTGTAVCNQPWQTAGYMEIRCKLVGYENTTATAQTYTAPTPFTDAGYFVGNVVPLASATWNTGATVIQLPTNMLAPIGTSSQPVWIDYTGD
jgi:hypothetical protein